jgi:hypothetical protein
MDVIWCHTQISKIGVGFNIFQLEFLSTHINQLIKLAMITMTFKRHHINKFIGLLFTLWLDALLGYFYSIQIQWSTIWKASTFTFII